MNDYGSPQTISQPSGTEALQADLTHGDDISDQIAARLLYPNSDDTLRDLGYGKPQLADLADMRRQPYGVILISGLAGSADGASDENQRADLRRVISAMLRIAPSVHMLGEARDRFSATLAFDMAKTGHLVSASVDANTAIDSILRLREMNVSTTDLGNPVLIRGLIAQRPVRTVCPECAYHFDDPAERAAAQQGAPLIDPDTEAFYLRLRPELRRSIRMARPGGCPHCNVVTASISTGHKGCKVVAETVIPTRDSLAAVLADRPNLAQEIHLSRPGSVAMFEHAIWRVLIGECDPRDVSETVGAVSLGIDATRVSAVMERLS